MTALPAATARHTILCAFRAGRQRAAKLNGAVPSTRLDRGDGPRLPGVVGGGVMSTGPRAARPAGGEGGTGGLAIRSAPVNNGGCSSTVTPGSKA